MHKTLSEFIAPDLIEVTIPKLPEYPRIVGSRHQVDKVARLELTKVNGKCVMSSKMMIDSNYHEVDRMHLGIKYLPPFIKYVTLFNGTRTIFTLR
jgi:hypothetical protein